LSLLLRKTLGVGKPRRLQGTAIGVIASFMRLLWFLWAELRRAERRLPHFAAQSAQIRALISNNSELLGKLPPPILPAAA
jgi:hypothetical protein